MHSPQSFLGPVGLQRSNDLTDEMNRGAAIMSSNVGQPIVAILVGSFMLAVSPREACSTSIGTVAYSVL